LPSNGTKFRMEALMSTLIGPTTLRAAGIEFDIGCAGPGDMSVTKPRCRHIRYSERLGTYQFFISYYDY
jgi:hypothetical protein